MKAITCGVSMSSNDSWAWSVFRLDTWRHAVLSMVFQTGAGYVDTLRTVQGAGTSQRNWGINVRTFS